MYILDFHQLEYVMAIVEEKSISKAAKKLYISQPSLSQYIMRLEESLGVKLFSRTGKSLTLTFAGEKYVETARKILNLNSKLNRELSDIACCRKGRLRIGIPNQTSRYILPLVLPEFNKKFPEVEIIIEEDVSLKLENMLAEGKLDIAILNLPIGEEKLTYEIISIERIFLVAPKNHKIVGKDEVKLKSLEEEMFILLKQGQKMRTITEEIFHKAQISPKVSLQITNLDTAYRIAASGMGFTFIPENVIWIANINEYKNYFLVDGISFTLVVAYREDEYLSKASIEFINIAKKVIKIDCEKNRNKRRKYSKIILK